MCSSKNREDLLFVRYRLAPHQPPLHLVDLPQSMSDIAFDRATSNSIDARVPQGVKSVHRPLDQPAAAGQIRLHALRMPLRSPRRPHPVEQTPDLSGQIPPLTPSAHRMLPRRPSRLPQQAPHRVPQQADVRRVVHVGLDHERVTPAAQWLARLFFSDLVPTLHYQLPHRRQQLGGQQGHVVHHPLVLVTRPVAEITVPQERAYRLVMVRQVVQTVEVTAQALLENAQHQDLPQLHPRTPNRAVGLRHDMLVQQRKQTSAQLLVGPDVLKPLQHRRDVVPRLRVDPDLLDGHLSDLELPPVHFSHGVAVAKIPPKETRIDDLNRKNTTSRTIFATHNPRYVS